MARRKKIENMSDDEIANLSDEAIEKYNAEQKEKFEERKAKQARNRSKAVNPIDRDRSVVRGISGPGQVKCISVRKIGLDDGISDAGEVISLPKEIASRLQDCGAIKVAL
jgi:hypothetical protein